MPQAWEVDEGALWGAAATLRSTGGELDRVRQDLNARVAALDADWQGRASDAFRGSWAVRSGLLAGLDANLAEAAGVLAGYADAVVEAQGRFAQASRVAAADGLPDADSGRPRLLGPPYDPEHLAAFTLFQERSAAATAAAAAAAERAAQALDRLADEAARLAGEPTWLAGPGGPPGPLAPVAAAALVLLQAVTPQAGPRSTDPAVVAGWWAALSPEQQRRLLAANPRLLGGLDGIPIDVRDQANRRLLADERARLRQERDDLVVAMRITGDLALGSRIHELDGKLARLDELQRELADVIMGHPELTPADVKLVLFDPEGDGRAAVAIGEVAAARHVAVVVPGMGNRLDNFGGPLADTTTLYAAMRDLRPDRPKRDFAAVAWLGYDTPEGIDESVTDLNADQLDIHRATEVFRDENADRGAPRLAQFVDGIRAVSGDRDTQHVTVTAHSYGTLVTAKASRLGLAADDLALVGSVGLDAQHVTELGTDPGHVWVGRTRDDYVQGLFVTTKPHGPDPSLPAFGAQPIPVGDRFPDQDPRPYENAQHAHSDYYQPQTRGLDNLARIVVGEPPEAPP
jgi:uncharacterized protein YukE